MPLQDQKTTTKPELQTVEMATREDDTVTLTLVVTKLKPQMMDWSVEDVHKEYTVFKPMQKCV